MIDNNGTRNPLIISGITRFQNLSVKCRKPTAISIGKTLEGYVALVTGIPAKLIFCAANEKIFGVNLYEAGLGELTEQYFVEMLAGKGAVEATLAKYV